MVLHEAVAEVIDRVVVDREEIPRLVIQQPSRGGMDAHAFRERPHEHGQALVLILIDLSGQRNERLHHLRRQQVGMHAQIGQRLGQFRRMNRIRRQRPALVERPAGAVVMVGNHHAVDRLGGMAGPPADHDAAQTVLIENVPQRFRFSREVGDRLHAASVRSGLGEAVDAVLERPLSGGDGSPQHRRERRMQRGDLPRGAVFDQALDVGHFAGVHERTDDLPVGGVPPDQKNFTRGHLEDSASNFVSNRSLGWYGAFFLCLRASPLPDPPPVPTAVPPGGTPLPGLLVKPTGGI